MADQGEKNSRSPKYAGEIHTVDLLLFRCIEEGNALLPYEHATRGRRILGVFHVSRESAGRIAPMVTAARKAATRVVIDG